MRRDDPLIVNRHGRPVNRDGFRARVVRPALRAAGLPESLRTYDIRHSHASLLIDDGANVLAVAQRMGHFSGVPNLCRSVRLSRSSELRQRPFCQPCPTGEL